MKYYAAFLLVFLGLSLSTIGNYAELNQIAVSNYPEVKDLSATFMQAWHIFTSTVDHEDLDALTQEETENNFYLDQEAINKIIYGRFYTKEEVVEPGTYPIIVTGYSSTVAQCDADPFITASGQRVRDGIAAANFLPLGARFKIPSVFGDKIFIVEDRMAVRHWGRIDIWFGDYFSALSFGVRKLDVEILPSISVKDL